VLSAFSGFLAVANLMGVFLSLSSSPSHGTKRRLKAILNLDKLTELFNIGWKAAMLFVGPYTPDFPRETYVVQIMHSAFFLLQCHTVTRLVWDEKMMTGSIPTAPQLSRSYETEEPQSQFTQQQYSDQHGYYDLRD